MLDNLYLRESAARAAQPVPRTQFTSCPCPRPCPRLAAVGSSGRGLGSPGELILCV